jgi:hypothetical protein
MDARRSRELPAAKAPHEGEQVEQHDGPEDGEANTAAGYALVQ